MHRFPGERVNTWVYHYKGYSYKHDDRGSHKIYRCKGVKCKASIRLLAAGEFENPAGIKELGIHICQKDDTFVQRKVFLARLKEVYMERWSTPLAVYTRVMNEPRFRPILRHKECSFDFCQRLMSKWKKEKMPPYPKDMKELHELILIYDPILPFFKGMATGTDGSIALIFIIDIMLRPLNECSQLFCDGTFQSRPRLPKCAQLYTIHFRKIDKGFPAISCLTTKKTKAMYNAIWDKIFDIVPNMKQNVKSITMDFEKAQIASVESKFPNTVKITGCNFHYRQALVKRWGRAKIGTEYEYLLEQSYAVAHLPADKIEEGFNSITQQIDCLPDSPQKVKLVLFASYLRRYWLPLAPVLSVYKCKVKTNNSCENFHLNAARILGKRPPIWQFLELLFELMNKYAQDYDRFISGKQPVASLKVDDTEWKTKVAYIEERLRGNEVSVRDFVQFIGFSKRVDFCRLHIENAIRGAKDHRDPFEPIVVEEEAVEIDEDTTEDADWILQRVVNTPPPVQDLELMPMPENANAQVARRQVARRGGRSNPVVNIGRETAQVARRQVARRGGRSNPVVNIGRETAQVARRDGRTAQVAKRGRRSNPVANIGREIAQVSTREYTTPQVARRGGRTAQVAQWGQRSNSVANINLETVQVSTREYATPQVARRGGGMARSTMRNNPRPATLEFQSHAIDQHLTSAFVHIERLDRLSLHIERDASSETEEEEVELHTIDHHRISTFVPIERFERVALPESVVEEVQHHPINYHRIPGFVPIERFERAASPEPVVEEVEQRHAIDQHLISAFVRIERLERDAPPAPVVEEVELSSPATPSSFANRNIEEIVVYDFNEQPSTSRANSREEESDDDTPMLPASFVRAARLRRFNTDTDSSKTFLSSETIIEAESHAERSETDQIEEVAHSETAMEIETSEIAQSNGTETDEGRSEAEVEEVNPAFNRLEQMDEVAPAEQGAVVSAEQGTMASAEHAALAPVVLPTQAEIAPRRKKRKRGCKSSKIRGNKYKNQM